MNISEALAVAIESRLADLHTAMPGKVEKVSSDGQRVDVLPQLKRAVSDGEGGYVIEDLPVIPNVPVAFPRAGGFFVSFPIARGDMVLLVFAERSVKAWMRQGQAVDPGDRRMHPFDGAIAIPGVYPNNSPLDDASSTDMVMGKDGETSPKIVLKPSGDIVLNGGTKKVARVDDTAKADTAMATWMSQVESGIAGAGGAPPTPSASTFNAISIAKINSGADKVKA